MRPTKTIANWDQLATFLQALPPVDLAFRGQGRKYGPADSHLLTARIDRCITLPHLGDRLRMERAVSQRFREHAPIYLSPLENRYLVTPWLQLVVMQHYGVPTRLLDWTKSPWVGAYFAVSSQWESDGYMYGFRRNVLERELRRRFACDVNGLVWGPRKPGMHLAQVNWDLAEANSRLFYSHKLRRLSKWVATYYCREAHFPRLVAQQGLFTFASRPNLNHWDHICRLLKSATSDNVWLVRIKSDAKVEILRRLNGMGLNGATLFPGADGIGRSLEGFARSWHLHPRPSQF